jgi:acyl-CoA reductase-like NAD-dependent aldehyde dehydrogenase
VRDAVTQGATVRSGGGCPDEMRGSNYYAPTILDNIAPAMEIFREEVFGPVVTVTPFEDEAEAIALANDSRFGLAGAVWTRDPARAHRVAATVQAGTFWINGYKTISVMSPFGGFADSGHGRSSGREALMSYTTTKSIWVETAADPAPGFGYD